MKHWLSSLLLCITPLFCFPAIADTAYPIISVLCDEGGDVLKIKNEVKWNEEGKNFPFSAANGTYNPWDWIKHVKTETSEGIIQATKLELSCQLSNNLYKIVLEPKIFNANMKGKCGDRISARVTIFRGGSILIDDKPFEEFCLGNAEVIRGIKVMGKSGQVQYYKVPKHSFFSS